MLLEDADSDSDELEPSPFVCVFDNAYLLDIPSWNLIERIKLSCERISFILICKTDELGQLYLLPESKQFANEFLSNPDNVDIMLELSGLDIKEMKDMFCQVSI